MTHEERESAALKRAYIENQEHTRKDDTLANIAVIWPLVTHAQPPSSP